MASVHPSALIPEGVSLAEGCEIAAGVVFAGPARIQEDVRIGAGAIIADGVEIGIGAEVLPGAVVMASVPANAVAQGNPAQIVGYRSLASDGAVHAEKVETFSLSSRQDRRDMVDIRPLGVGGAALYLMPKVPDLRGNLTVGEIERDLPFIPKRYFAIFDVPTEKLRGEHAHFQCAQFLICLSGSCRALIDDGSTRKEVVLDRPDIGLYMPPMLWGTQYRYSRDAVLLVFASHSYDAGDYIRTYDAFKAAVDNRKPEA